MCLPSYLIFSRIFPFLTWHSYPIICFLNGLFDRNFWKLFLFSIFFAILHWLFPIFYPHKKTSSFLHLIITLFFCLDIIKSMRVREGKRIKHIAIIIWKFISQTNSIRVFKCQINEIEWIQRSMDECESTSQSVFSGFMKLIS